MVQVAELQVSITADDSSFQQGVQGADNSIKELAGSAALLSGSKALGSFLGDSVGMAADFEFQMDAVQASLGKIDPSVMGDLSAQAKDLGANSKYTATEVGAIQEEMAKMGVSAEDMLAGATQGVIDLASATGEDLTTSAQVASAALNQFGLGGSDMTRVADVMTAALNASSASLPDFATGMNHLGPVMSSLGFDVEDAAAAIAYFNQYGMKAADVGVSVARMFGELASPGSQARQTMDALGISAFDAEGNMKSLPDIMDNLQSSFQGLSQQEQLDLVSKIFGAESADVVLRAIQEGGDGLRGVREEVTANGQAAAAAEQRMDNFWGSVEKFGGALDTARMGMTEGFLPALKGIVDAGAGAVDFFNQLPPEVQSAAGAVVGLTAGVMGLVGAMAGWSVISGPVTQGLGTLGTMASKALPFIGKMTPLLAAGALGLAAYENNWFGVGDAVDGAVDATKGAVKAFKAARQAAKDGGYSELTSDVLGLGSALSDLGWDGAAEKVTNLGRILGVAETQFDTMLNSGINPLTAGLWSLAAGIESVGGDTGVVDWLRRAGDGALETATQFDSMLKSGIDPVTAGLWSLAAGIEAAGGNQDLVNFLRDAGDATQTFGDLFQGAVDAGLNPFHAAAVGALGAIEDLAGGTTGATQAMRDFVNWVAESAPKVKEAIGTVASEIGSLASEVMSGDFDAAGERVGEWFSNLGTLASDAANWVMTVGAPAAIEWAQGGLESIGTWINDQITSFVSEWAPTGEAPTIADVPVAIGNWAVSSDGLNLSGLWDAISAAWNAPDIDMASQATALGEDIGGTIGEALGNAVSLAITTAMDAIAGGGAGGGGATGNSDVDSGMVGGGQGWSNDLIDWGTIFTNMMAGLDAGLAEGFDAAAGPALERLGTALATRWEEFKTDLWNQFIADIKGGANLSNDPLLGPMGDALKPLFDGMQNAMIEAAGGFAGPEGGMDANGIGTNREASTTMVQEFIQGWWDDQVTAIKETLAREVVAEAGAFKDMVAPVGKLWESLFTNLNNALVEAGGAFAGPEGGMDANGIGTNRESSSTMVEEFLQGWWDDQVTAIQETIQGWSDDAQSNFQEIADTITTVVGELWSTIGDAITQAVTDYSGPSGGADANGIGTNREAGGSAVGDAVEGMLTGFLDSLAAIPEKITTGIREAATNAATAIKEAGAEFWQTVQQAMTDALSGGGANGNVPQPDGSIVDAAGLEVQNAPGESGWSQLWELLVPPASAAGATETTAPPEVQQRLNEQASGMAESLANAMSQSLTSPEFTTAFETALTEGDAETFNGLGASLMTALQEGITTALHTPVENFADSGMPGPGGGMAQTMVQGLVDQLMASVDTISPEVFAPLGTAIAAKLQAGLATAMTAAPNSMGGPGERGEAGTASGGMATSMVQGLASSLAAGVAAVGPEAFAPVGQALMAKVSESLAAALSGGGAGGKGASGQAAPAAGGAGSGIAAALAQSLAAEIQGADFSAVGQAIQAKIAEVMSTSLSATGGGQTGQGPGGGQGVPAGGASGIGQSIVSSIVTAVTSADWSSLTTTFETKAQEAATGFATGIETGMTEAQTAVDTAVTTIGTSFDTLATDIGTAGTEAGAAFATGMDGGLQEAVGLAEQAAADVAAALDGAAATAEASGAAVSAGFAAGIRGGIADVKAAAGELAAAGTVTVQQEIQQASPSKVTRRSGMYFGMGFVQGIRGQIDSAVSAARAMAQGAAGGVNGSGSGFGGATKEALAAGESTANSFIQGLASRTPATVAKAKELARKAMQQATTEVERWQARAGKNAMLGGIAEKKLGKIDNPWAEPDRYVKLQEQAARQRSRQRDAERIAAQEQRRLDRIGASSGSDLGGQMASGAQQAEDAVAESATQMASDLGSVGTAAQDAAGQVGSSFQDAAGQMGGAASDAQQSYNQAMSDIAGSVGTVEPTLEALAGKTLEFADAMANAGIESDRWLAVADGLQQAGQAALDGSGSVEQLGSALQAAQTYFDENWDMGAEFVQWGDDMAAGMAALQQQLGGLGSAAQQAGQQVGQGFGQGLQAGWDTVNPAMLGEQTSTALQTASTQALPAAEAAGAAVGGGYGTALLDAVGGANRTAESQITGMQQYFQEIYGQASRGGQQAGQGFADGLTQAAPAKQANQTLQELSKSITTGGNQAARQAQQAGMGIGQSLADGIQQSGTSAIQTATQVQNRVNSQLGGTFDAVDMGKVDTGNVVNSVNGTLSKLARVDGSKEGSQVGATFGSGLAAGASSKSSIINSAVKELVDQAYEAGKKAANAKSPSKRFAELGGYLSQGMAVGIARDASRATLMMRNLVGEIEDEAAAANPILPGVDFGAVPALPAGAVIGGGQTVTIYQNNAITGTFGTGEEWDSFMYDRAAEANVGGARA